MVKVAEFIDRAILAANDENKLAQIAEEVKNFLKNFPLYEGGVL